MVLHMKPPFLEFQTKWAHSISLSLLFYPNPFSFSLAWILRFFKLIHFFIPIVFISLSLHFNVLLFTTFLKFSCAIFIVDTIYFYPLDPIWKMIKRTCQGQRPYFFEKIQIRSTFFIMLDLWLLKISLEFFFYF